MFKFIKLPKDVATWILVVILAVHTGWVLNHLRLHSQGQINPWKGGGYGMYTNINPKPNFFVWTSDVTPVVTNRSTRVLEPSTRSLLENQSLINTGRFFRCSPVSEFALIQFVRKNRPKLKQYSVIKIRSLEISRENRSTKVTIVGSVQFDIANNYVNYTSKICGNEKSGRVRLNKSFGL